MWNYVRQTAQVFLGGSGLAEVLGQGRALQRSPEEAINAWGSCDSSHGVCLLTLPSSR
jgi:hypothetical protein